MSTIKDKVTELIHHLPEELIEGVEIQSPFMPPKRKFKVQLKI